MTPAQRHLYWRAWAQAARAQGWDTVGGLRNQQPPPECADPVQNLIHDAMVLAMERAGQEPLRPDHVRHAIHQIVLGRDCSSRDLQNRELDLVLAAFRLLANPTDLGAIMTLGHDAANHTTRRRRWWLTHCVRPAYLRRVMADFFGHTDLDRLDDGDIATLHAIIKRRVAAAAYGRAP
jgi:hypothetical protein